MQMTSQDKVKILLETYKKHAQELLSLEESQQKLVTILLGVFAAGITYVSGVQRLPMRLAIPIIVMAILFAIFGGVYTHKRDKARASIRELMVAIEKAMGFYEPGLYIEGQSLYPERLKQYSKARWLGAIYTIVVLAAFVFIVIVISRVNG